MQLWRMWLVAIRRMPHLQHVSDRSHRADRDDVVVWKLEELVCVVKVRGDEHMSNKVPSESHIDPPIQTEYFLFGRPTTLIFIVGSQLSPIP